MKYIIYARKSSEDKKRQLYSIEDQLKILQKLAKDRKLSVYDEITEEKSAKEVGRPGFIKMVKLIESGVIQGVICWDADRLARNMIDGATLSHMLQNGILKEIVTPTEIYDKDTDTIILSIKFGMATQFIRTLKKNITRGMMSRLEKGYHPTSCPLGYDAKGKGERVPNEFFPLIKKTFELYDTGKYSLRTLAIEMARRGFKTKTGNPINKSGIENVLKNPFYYGDIVWGRTTTDKPQVFKGNHKPAITKALFDRVQARISGKRVKGFGRHFYSYNNLIEFAGVKLVGEHQKKHIYYRYNPRVKKACFVFHWKNKDRKTIREDWIDEIFAGFFSKIKFTKEAIKKLERIFDKKLEKAEENNNNQKKTLQLKLNNIGQRVRKLKKDYYSEKITASEFREMRDEVKNEKKDILKSINDLERESLDEYFDSIEEFSVILKILQDYSALNRERKSVGVELFFESVKVSRGVLKMKVRPEIEDLLDIAKYPKTRTSKSHSTKGQSGILDNGCPMWYTRRDSNPRHPVPKTGALSS